MAVFMIERAGIQWVRPLFSEGKKFLKFLSFTEQKYL